MSKIRLTPAVTGALARARRNGGPEALDLPFAESGDAYRGRVVV